jgi:hypothetical protein
MVAAALLVGTPFFVVMGTLSDRIGRKPIILAGCLIAALTYFPIFGQIAKIGNPTLMNAHDKVKVTLIADPATCGNVFDPINIRTFTAPCDVARRALATAAIKYEFSPGAAGSQAKAMVGADEVPYSADFAKNLTAASIKAGYPAVGDAQILKQPTVAGVLTDSRSLQMIGLLFILVIYVTMVYGPIAALLVELFPTRIRYTGMSLPYHLGNGWFGGFLPPTAFAIVAATGDIFAGLWYPIVVALMTFVIGLIFLPETKSRDIYAGD